MIRLLTRRLFGTRFTGEWNIRDLVILVVLFFILQYFYENHLVNKASEREAEIVRAERAEKIRKENTPVSDWFVVKDIFVPDVTLGQDPVITVDRIIRKDFVAAWIVEVHSLVDGKWVLTCGGSGENNYKTTDELPPKIHLLSWWANSPDCKLPEGTHRADTKWIVKPHGYPSKVLEKSSNAFKVISPGTGNTRSIIIDGN